MRRGLLLLVLTACATQPASKGTVWPAPQSAAVSGADGYVAIPGAAVPPDSAHTYKAVFDATRGSASPTEILPALNMAGSELNAFAAAGVPLDKVKFVVVFHGAAIDGILEEGSYERRFGTSNPNLPVLAQMKKAGVQLLVCGQNLAFENIDPKSIASDVQVACDALIVLMTYQNDGYALLSF